MYLKSHIDPMLRKRSQRRLLVPINQSTDDHYNYFLYYRLRSHGGFKVNQGRPKPSFFCGICRVGMFIVGAHGLVHIGIRHLLIM